MDKLKYKLIADEHGIIVEPVGENRENLQAVFIDWEDLTGKEADLYDKFASTVLANNQ